MKYPMEIVSLVRNKTFSVEAHLFKRKPEDDKPLQVFDDNYSRFVFAAIENGKAASCNIHVEDIAGMKAKSLYAFNKQMDSVASSVVPVDKNGSDPAYTVRFAMGSLKGKSPAEVLLSDPNGEEVLNKQYQFLKQNLAKFPDNQKLIDAIVNASKLKKEGKLEVTEMPASAGNCIPIHVVSCRPLVRKPRPNDGFCPCYEMNISWDTSKKYPVAVTISNYYAPVEKKENGLLNAVLSRKDKTSEISVTFNMSGEEWLDSIEKISRTRDNFERINFGEAYKLASNALFENRTAAKGQ